MDTKALAEFVETRLCHDCRQGYTCEHYDCEQGMKVADLLKRMEPFQGKDGDGNAVSGWLIRA